MDWTLTLINLAAGAGGFALCSWRAQLPTQFGKVRLIPWTFLSLACAVWAIFMLVHVVNLLGIETGGARPSMR
jgi:hypothetical protein